jgi:hypothetical protein
MNGTLAVRRALRPALALVITGAFAVACSEAATTGPIPTVAAVGSALSVVPVKPNFNLEVILRPTGAGDGFGHVKFRQNNDDATIVDLGVWVRDLAPNTHYRLQRAVDAANVLDDVCASQSWLTLGLGTVAQDIVTDDRGTAKVDLFRVLAAAGPAFDIHFRVVTATAPPVAVLESECYQFFVR